MTFEEACGALEAALSVRRSVVEDAARSGDLHDALRTLRSRMRTHRFPAGDGGPSLASIVRELEARTRRDGFQVLRDWDGNRSRPNPEIIPVDMVDHLLQQVRRGRADRTALGILVDYYFLYLIALLVLRAWDEGDPDAHLDRLDGLLERLQGRDGAGYRLVSRLETLLWIAVSAYHPDTDAYPQLLEKVRASSEERQNAFARISAPVLGSHLRWGLVALYGHDPERLRRDNTTDYPWLLFAVSRLAREYSALDGSGVDTEEHGPVVDALLNGLTADPGAFTGEIPECLLAERGEYESFVGLYRRHAEDLLEEFEARRPVRGRFSPLSFHFNFPHNVLKATVATALAAARPGEVLPFEALVTWDRGGGTGREREMLARRLMMDFGRASPERTRAGPVVMIVYDPGVGGAVFEDALRVARAAGSGEDGVDVESAGRAAEGGAQTASAGESG